MQLQIEQDFEQRHPDVRLESNIQPMLDAFQPMIWAFGLIIGTKVRLFIRRVSLRKLESVL
jgi:hypothetical protein